MIRSISVDSKSRRLVMLHVACNLGSAYYPCSGFPRICICKPLPNSHPLYARQGSDWASSCFNPATPGRSP